MIEKKREEGEGEANGEAKTMTSSMMKTRRAAPHVATAAFSPSLQQYVLLFLVALRQLRRWREHDAASRLLLQRTRAQPAPPTVSVKESNCAVVDFVVGGMAEGCSC